MNIDFHWVNESETPDRVIWLAEEIMERLVTERFERASDLMFHTIHVDDDPEGPIVMAYGKDGDDSTVHMHYLERAFA